MTISRQLLSQRRHVANGLCRDCSNEIHPGSTAFCLKHLELRRSRYKKKGSKRTGRHPIPR